MFEINYYRDGTSDSDIEKDVWDELTCRVYIKASSMEEALAKFRENYNNTVQSIHTADHFDYIS